MKGYSAEFGSSATGIAVGEGAQALTFIYKDYSGQIRRTGFTTLLHLLDRRTQFATLNPQCKTAFTATPKRPLIVLVPGSKAQRHEVLFNRFRWFTVPMIENDLAVENLNLVTQHPDAAARYLEWPKHEYTIQACVDETWGQIADHMAIERAKGARGLCAGSNNSKTCTLCSIHSPDDDSCETLLRKLRAKLFWERLNKNGRSETFYIHLPDARFDARQSDVLKRMVEFWNAVGELGIVVPVTVFFSFSWPDSLRDSLRRFLPLRRDTSEMKRRRREHRAQIHCRASLPENRKSIEIAVLEVLGDVRREDVTLWLDHLGIAERPIAEKLSEIRDELENEFGRWKTRSMNYVFSRFSAIAERRLGRQR